MFLEHAAYTHGMENKYAPFGTSETNALRGHLVDDYNAVNDHDSLGTESSCTPVVEL